MRSDVSWCPVEKANIKQGQAQQQPAGPCTPRVPAHPWAWREDEAASGGPELGSCSLRAAGHGTHGSGLDVHVELSGLLIVKIRVTRGKPRGCGCAWASVKEPTLNVTTLLPPRTTSSSSVSLCSGSYRGSSVRRLDPNIGVLPPGSPQDTHR